MTMEPSSLSSSRGSPADRSEFWKDDFAVLQHAGKSILSVLRQDESNGSGDLYRRMISTPSNSEATTTAEGSLNHHYFSDGSAPWKHAQSIPLPPHLQEQLSKAKMSTMMGMFPEAELAWMTIDDTVYIWTYSRSSDSHFLHFQVPSRQPIVSVGLAPPKTGVFRQVVEWCLVLTTKEEAMLCALARDNHQTFKIIPTKFVIPSDWVSFLSVTATKSGRIFLGGQDGNLYELDYDLLLQTNHHYGATNDAAATQQKLDDFYDGRSPNANGSCPAVLHQGNSQYTSSIFAKGKRIIDTLSSSLNQPPRKCRKLNHSQSPISSYIPEVINRVTNAVFGDYTTTGGGPIIQMVVDHERQVLYTLSTRGWICALDIADSPKITLAAVLSTPQTARSYLEAVSRGRMFAPAPSNARDGLLTFPGGGEAAQAGVGGMEGARQILKQEEADKNNRRQVARNSILTPVSIQVVPNQESTRITLVAITAGGLRYYLSSLGPQTLGAGPTSPPFGTPRHRHPWRPHSRLTLCHVRAPPSLKEAIVAAPHHSPEISKDHRVDAACYRLGVFMVAFQHKAQKTPPAAGNIMVVANADSVARLQDKNKKDKSTIVTYIPPGGVCEVTSLPMSMGSSADLAHSLPGGRVWQVCAATFPRDSLWSLSLRSKTPTDTELSFGIAPAYYPPSSHKKMLPVSSSKTTPTSRALVQSPSTQRSMSFLAANIVTNLILSRPVRYGIEVQKPVAHQERHVLYRISKRCGSQGFSLSAADNKSNTSTASSKSARLSPWLLCPDIVPLNPLALQHLEPPNTTFIALNAGGIHSFQRPSILQRLSFSIQAAGTNVRADSGVSKFFQDYGHAEGCAMCLVLAMKPSNSQELKESALRAALARAYRPTLVPAKSDDQPSEQPRHHDPWIPSGYSFTSSALCNGLTLILARLLRPVWHKPGVVVTEGRMLKRGSSSTGTPAKVELLMDDETLGEVRRPLFAMQQVMKRVFGGKALAAVPLSRSASIEKDQMEVDDDANYYLTRALEYQKKGQSQTTNDTFMRPSDAEALAQHIEERNIHLLYRLLSRTTQLLSLLSHLRRAHLMPELPEVEWGLLHGITVAQLVQTRDGQERVETLLNSLITSGKAAKKTIPTQSADSNELAGLLAQECFFFFSPGSRYAYLGFKCAEEALAIQIGQTRRSVRSKDAEKYFKLAATNWYSAPLITGRLMHTSREKESYSDIARRAEKCGSPLAKACSLLIELENVAAVVDLCLSTAANFSGQKKFPINVETDFYQGSSVFGWEKGLYQQRQGSANNASSNSTPAANSLALGTSVTASDAISTCYALVFHHLSKLLDSSSSSLQYELGEKMVSVSCSFESDKAFLHAFFKHLLEQNHEDVLLRIDSRELQTWLETQKKDRPGLLLKYYQNQGRHIEAAKAAWGRANSPNLDLSLNDRIECLVDASDSFTMATKRGQGNADELGRKKKEVDERLEIARMQARVRQTLASTKYELPKDDVDRLSHSLLSANDLFNKYAMPCDMYENCLLILHVCRHDDVVHIQKFWKSIFCAEVFPCATRSQQTYRILRSFSEGSFLENPVVTLLQEGTSSDESLFENGGWMKRVEGRIVALGREVFGHGADFVFPIEFVLSNLEDLRRAYAACMRGDEARESQGWPLSIMAAVGIPYLVVLSAFEQLIEQENHATMGGVAPTRRLEHLQTVITMLELFETSARSGFQVNNNVAFEEMSNAVASGAFLGAIEGCKAKLHALPGDVSAEESRLILLEKACRQYSG